MTQILTYELSFRYPPARVEQVVVVVKPRIFGDLIKIMCLLVIQPPPTSSGGQVVPRFDIDRDIN